MAELSGESWVFLGGDGLYLSVPFSDPKPIEDVIEDILFFGVIDIGLGQLDRLVRTNRGKTVRIAERIIEVERDDCAVSLSEDRLVAFFSADPKGDRLTFFAILSVLRAAGIRYGIDYQAVEKIAQAENQRCSGVIVARGKAPLHGRDGALEYQFDPEVNRAPLILENGAVDFRQVDVIKCVARDDLLVTRVPPTEGKPGMNVIGEVIPANRGQEVSLPVGDRTYTDRDRIELRAAVPGHVYMSQDRVSVEEILIIKGNVDFSTGNLDFKGDAIIQGTVLSGFTVCANGNIEIGGDVESGTLISRKGNVSIKGGVVGHGKAKITAAGSIQVRFADGAVLVAQDTISIRDSLINCQVTAGRRVELGQGKGMIVGGQVTAGLQVSARTLGSTASNATLIRVCPDRGASFTKRISTLKESLSQITRMLERAQASDAELKRLGDKIWDLPEMRRDRVRREAHALSELQAESRLTEAAIAQAEQDLRDVDNAFIEILGRAHPGVTLQIREESFRLEKEIGAVLLKWREGAIRVTPAKKS